MYCNYDEYSLFDNIEKNDHNFFYKDVLKAWQVLQIKNRLNEGIHMQYIWFNKRIQIRKQSIYCSNFFNIGIHHVQDLYDDQGIIIPFNIWNRRGLCNIDFIKWCSLVTLVKQLEPLEQKQQNDQPKNLVCYYKKHTMVITRLETQKNVPLLKRHSSKC